MSNTVTEGPERLINVEIGGKYKIIRVLGEGGMGCVYQGEQKLGATIRKVAIKTLHEHLSHDPQILARFEREVGTVAALQHPNTIQVFDFGKMDDGMLYIVMEFVEGQSVAAALEKGGPMDPARVVKILQQVCGSLEEAHNMGIVHRDLKPDNIVLCDKAGQRDWVEVLDFGIAKRSSETDEREQKLTQQGMVLGTPPYMSPEQFTGRPVDRRSDIYSLSVMAYEMLTVNLPFSGNTAWEWATAHMTAPPRPLESFPLGQRVPAPMRAAILRGLEKDPNNRFPTVTAFFEAFSSPVSGAMAMAPMTTPQGPVDYARGQTQMGAPVQPYATGPHAQAQSYPTGPQPGYPTPAPYVTPPQGAHTYTPQPFPQAPIEEPRKKSNAVLIGVIALFLVVGAVAFVFILGSQGYISLPWSNKSAAAASTGTTVAANTAPTASVTAAPTDTGTIEPLASLATTHPNVVSPGTNVTAKKDAGAVTPPTYTTTQPTYTTTAPPTYPTYTTAPTYPTTPPTSTRPAGQQPMVCRVAKEFYARGQMAQAQRLAQQCVNAGGQQPF